VRWLALALLLALASPAWAGELEASWTAPTTNVDGSPLTDLASYRVYWFLYPNAPCPGTQFLVVPASSSAPAPGTRVSKTLAGLTQGLTYNVQVTAVDAEGLESACSPVATAAARPDPPIVTFGETTAFAQTDCCNVGRILASRAALTAPGTLTGLSMYVTSPDGSVLRLGLYADAGGRPGAKLAEVAEFTPVAGWNTRSVAPVTLAAGTYWLAFTHSGSTPFYPVDMTGLMAFSPFAYGPMPASWPPGTLTNGAHYAMYGTVATGSGAVPRPGTNLKLEFQP